MADKITQLERLNRLRAEGGLSDEEFEREKKKLFEHRGRLAWIAVAVAAAGLFGGFLVLALLRRGPSEPVADNPASTPTRVAETAAVPAPPPAPAAPRPLDISSPLGARSSRCSFASDLQSAFTNMLHHEGNRLRPRTVRFGDMAVTPSLISREEGVYNATVNFPRPLLWNGLRLTGLRAEQGWEWGSSTLVFADTPARVRAAITRMGIRMPASGNLQLPDDGGCGGDYVAVERRGSGATLTCGGGC